MRAGRAPTGPAVLVLPAGARSAPWACRSLSDAGFRVFAADGQRRLIARTRHAHELLEHPFPIAPHLASFLDWLDETCRKHRIAAVLPASEPLLHALVRAWPRSNGAVLVGPTREQLDSLCDKAGLARLAQRAHVDTPTTAVVRPEGTEGDLPELPCIVKCQAATLFPGAGAASPSTVLARTERERDTAIRRTVAVHGAAVVQEWIDGGGWRVHFVRTGEGLHALGMRTLRRYPLRVGMSSVSVTAHMPEPLLASVERLLGAAGYRGLGSLQFLERRGRFFIHDANLRLPATMGIAVRAGLAAPALSVADALGVSLPPVPSRFRPVHYVGLETECAHLVDALRGREADAWAGRIAADLMMAAFRPGRLLDPFDLTDPLPFVGTLYSGLRRALHRERIGGAQRPVDAEHAIVGESDTDLERTQTFLGQARALASSEEFTTRRVR